MNKNVQREASKLNAKVHDVMIRGIKYLAYTIPANGFERLIGLVAAEGTVWRHKIMQ